MRRRAPARLRPLTVLGLALAASSLLVFGCGKTGTGGSDSAAGSPGDGGAKSGGSPAMVGGAVTTPAGGRIGEAGSSTGGHAGGTGGGASGAAASPAGAAAGAAGNGGTGAAGGLAGTGGLSPAEAGAGGAGGADALLGVDCRNTHCAVGDVCVSCGMPEGAEWRCAPHPVTAPQAYATATASCEPAPYGYNECDGPEDCSSDQYCVAKEGADGRQRCRSEPAPGHCCFTCNALVDCTLCRDDGDCPDSEKCAVVYEKLKGCTKSQF